MKPDVYLASSATCRSNLPPKAERRPTGDHIPLIDILKVTASGGIWL